MQVQAPEKPEANSDEAKKTWDEYFKLLPVPHSKATAMDRRLFSTDEICTQCFERYVFTFLASQDALEVMRVTNWVTER